MGSQEVDFSGSTQVALYFDRSLVRSFPNEDHLNRWNVSVALVALRCLCLGIVAAMSPQIQFIIDATKQPSPPIRANGPFPGSAASGTQSVYPSDLYCRRRETIVGSC